ncbi:integrase [Chryseotalea sanaruensis]|uniref:Integrase n=1 Tax=Chryseotalea sanaruensis TaxID=2482724 RepID=A0A401U682_9BACT|nr:tyrosine-type recombinase/integrase [Chryseotalea sanaruensis]GCC50350.1 integrase [Chryseotalea sanaruensis]
MKAISVRNSQVGVQLPKASQLLVDYEYWLKKYYGVTGAYLTNAKTFLRGYRQGGNVLSQLDDYSTAKAPTLRSILKRFGSFLEEKQVTLILNDLNESKLPISNVFVKLYLLSAQDRLRSKSSLSTYATILNGYFKSIKDDPSRINKRTAAKYILDPRLSDYTKSLYKAAIKSFCEWVMEMLNSSSDYLSKEQKTIKRGLKIISQQSIKEVIGIRVSIPRAVSSRYHKDSLTEAQRARLLKSIKIARDRSIIALMAWNGLRTIEVLRLTVSDIKLTEGKLVVWGKGRSEQSKESIKLSSIAKKEIKSYLVKNKIKRGLLFPSIKRVELDDLVTGYLNKLRIKGKFTSHSLRHTAGQIMYDKKIPLELIQKTLRHADMRTTMIYAQKAIDRNYFKRLKRF